MWPAVLHRFFSFDVSAKNVTNPHLFPFSITPWSPAALQMVQGVLRSVDLLHNFFRSFKQVCLAAKFLGVEHLVVHLSSPWS